MAKWKIPTAGLNNNQRPDAATCGTSAQVHSLFKTSRARE